MESQTSCASAKGNLHMRILAASVASLIFATLSGAALAQAQPQELSQPTMTPVSTSTGDASDNTMVCRMLYHNGALIRTQTCHTAAEWQALRYVTRREVEDTQIRSYTTLPH